MDLLDLHGCRQQLRYDETKEYLLNIPETFALFNIAEMARVGSDANLDILVRIDRHDLYSDQPLLNLPNFKGILSRCKAVGEANVENASGFVCSFYTC